MKTSKLTMSLLVLSAVAGTGCGDQPEPAFRLKTLRVLGMIHEPLWPAPGETTTLTPIIFNPGSAPISSYSWSWCPYVGSPNDGYPCMITPEQLAAGGVSGVPAADLGTGPTAQFPYTIDQTVLQDVCTNGIADPTGTSSEAIMPDCRFGFGLPVKMTVKTEQPVADKIDVVDTLRLQVDPNAAPNHNPTLGGMVAVLNGAEVPLDETAQVTLPRSQWTTIKLTIPASVSEEYPNPHVAICPTATPTLHEAMSLSWYVECGNLDKVDSGYREGINTLEDAGKNKWDPGMLKDCEQETARIIVVLRDTRQVLPETIDNTDPCDVKLGNRLTGGVAWTSATVRLGGAQ